MPHPILSISAACAILLASMPLNGCRSARPEPANPPPGTPAPTATARPAPAASPTAETRPPAPDRPTPAKPSTAAEATAAKPTPPDHSLTSDEYVQLGMPAADREWLGNDITRAAQVLTTLAESSPDKLPRFGSDRSGAVFARLADTAHFQTFKDKSMPAGTRLADFGAYLGGSSNVLKAYLAARQHGGVGTRELIELLASMLHATADGLGLIDEFAATISEDDPNYQTRMQGVERMRGGLATMVSGSLESLTERDTYPAHERLLLIDHLKQTLPTMLRYMKDQSREEMVRRVQEIARDDSLQDLRPAITELARLVRSQRPTTP